MSSITNLYAQCNEVEKSKIFGSFFRMTLSKLNSVETRKLNRHQDMLKEFIIISSFWVAKAILPQDYYAKQL